MYYMWKYVYMHWPPPLISVYIVSPIDEFFPMLIVYTLIN